MGGGGLEWEAIVDKNPKFSWILSNFINWARITSLRPRFASCTATSYTITIIMVPLSYGTLIYLSLLPCKEQDWCAFFHINKILIWIYSYFNISLSIAVLLFVYLGLIIQPSFNFGWFLNLIELAMVNLNIIIGCWLPNKPTN